MGLWNLDKPRLTRGASANRRKRRVRLRRRSWAVLLLREYVRRHTGAPASLSSGPSKLIQALKVH